VSFNKEEFFIRKRQRVRWREEESRGVGSLCSVNSIQTRRRWIVKADEEWDFGTGTRVCGLLPLQRSPEPSWGGSFAGFTSKR